MTFEIRPAVHRPVLYALAGGLWLAVGAMLLGMALSWLKTQAAREQALFLGLGAAAALLEKLSETRLKTSAHMQPGLYIAEISEAGYLGQVLYKLKTKRSPSDCVRQRTGLYQ